MCDVSVDVKCGRCGSYDGLVEVDGATVECYEERHDTAQDRSQGVLAAERYIGLQNKSYGRGVLSAAIEAVRLVFGGGR